MSDLVNSYLSGRQKPREWKKPRSMAIIPVPVKEDDEPCRVRFKHLASVQDPQKGLVYREIWVEGHATSFTRGKKSVMVHARLPKSSTDSVIEISKTGSLEVLT